MDNVFIERLWRSLKDEEIYLRENATVPVLRLGLARWFERYNTWRPHEALGNLTPAVFYLTTPGTIAKPMDEKSLAAA
jgi:putative transposase